MSLYPLKRRKADTREVQVGYGTKSLSDSPLRGVPDGNAVTVGETSIAAGPSNSSTRLPPGRDRRSDILTSTSAARPVLQIPRFRALVLFSRRPSQHVVGS